jgi:DNA-binding transcriptional ArsR family regulator
MPDLFTAIAEPHRRDILEALFEGEKAVGALVADLSLAQPQVSKHLRVLSDVGLVTSRADGRRRLYTVNPTGLGPFRDWLAKYEQAMSGRLDRIDDYLKELQRQGETQ